jgi:Fe-S-cluster-containing hydrogenase component 2
MGYLEDGILTLENIPVPTEERFRKGPVAIVECVQNIPCNPCVESCPQGAITMKASINDLPAVNFEKCNGCGLCVSDCPGLAIFLVDKSAKNEVARVGLPYEFLPLPEKGERVILLDRSGDVCGEGDIVKVRNAKTQDRTPVVIIAVEKNIAMIARNFRRKANAV